MKRCCTDRWAVRRITALLLAVTLVVGGCSGSPVRTGPVRTAGVVTGKYRLVPPRNPKAKPRYFLWIKTKDELAYVEVTEEMFHAVKEGEEVCIYCDSPAP